jgi:ATPase subunit of ABC transporter with duplicated ATPase domains
MYARLKKKEVRMKERELSEKEVELQIEEERRIEMKCLKEGLRLVTRQRLFSQRYQGGGTGAAPPDDQYARLDQIEKVIEECMGPNFEKVRREDEQENMELNLIQKKPEVLGVLAAKKKSSYTGGPMVRKKSISNDDVISRYSSNVGVTELTHSSHKVTENRLFIEGVTKILKDIIERLHLQKSNGQLRNCVNVLDLFRRSKAIVFVGPVCSGKTSILKIVSNALFVAFKVKLRTSVVNPATLTAKELYGSIEAF